MFVNMFKNMLDCHYSDPEHLGRLKRQFQKTPSDGSLIKLQLVNRVSEDCLI